MLKASLAWAGHWQIRRSCRMVHPDARHPGRAFIRIPLVGGPDSWTAAWTGRRSLATLASQEEALPVTAKTFRSSKALEGAEAAVDGANLPSPPPAPTPRKRGRKPKSEVVDGAAQQRKGLGGSGKRGREPRPPTAEQSSSRLKWTPSATLALSRCIVELAQWMEQQQQQGASETSPKEQLAVLAAAHPDLKGYTADELYRKRANMVYRARLLFKEKEKVAASLGLSVSDHEITDTAMAEIYRILPADFTQEVYRVLEPHLELLGLRRGGNRSMGVKSTTHASSMKRPTGEQQKQKQSQSMAKKPRGRPPQKGSAPTHLVENHGGSEKPAKVVLEGMDELLKVLHKMHLVENHRGSGKPAKVVLEGMDQLLQVLDKIARDISILC